VPDVELRFLTSQTKADTDQAGLVMELNGTVWLVNPDGTRTQLPGGEGGCEYLTCADGGARLDARGVQVVASEEEDGSSEVYVAVENPGDETRAAVVVQGDDEAGSSSVNVLAQLDGAAAQAGIYVEAADADASVKVYADRLHFDNGTPITRPVIDLGSGTLAADVANALADLGLVTLAP